MSGASALSAAKRRRGNIPVTPNPNPNNNTRPQTTKSIPQQMPHPLDILKDHEIRIRKLESLMNDHINRIALLESKDNDKKKPKQTVSFSTNNIEPTFSNLKLDENDSQDKIV